MKEESKFNERLETEVKVSSPVLYSILHANFLPVLNTEMSSSIAGDSNLFDGDELKPMSELLMLSKQDLLTNARIMLPFWYTIPVLSWICSILMKKPKNKKQKLNQKKSYTQLETQKKVQDDDEDVASSKPKSSHKPVSKKDALIEAAKKLEQRFVPEGSSLERELNSYRKQWNKMITKEANLNLTEDVNSLIRDYTRKVLRTLSAVSFTADRIQNLAETLINTPNMQKITEQEALYMYVQLYMVFLVRNM